MHQHHRHHPRGYVLMVVIVLGIVLASLAGILLYSTARDRAEGKQQQASIRAVYASEAAVAVGIEHLRNLLETKTAPSPADLDGVEVATRTTLGTALSSATFPVLSVKYFDPLRNVVQDTPTSASNVLVTITSGPNKGLRAQQNPIQVLTTARINNASATVADAIRVDLIPVFQFAVFFDGDLEFQRPAEMTMSGRVHANGDLYFSNGATVDFLSTVTSAGKIHSHSAISTSVTVGSTANNSTRFNVAGTQVRLANTLPLGDAAQKTYLQSTFGVGGALQDRTTGFEPMSIPLRMSSSATCSTSAQCGSGRSCVKVRVSDGAGVCTNNITSRPDQCSNGSAAEFAQSLAVELIKRPAADYANVGPTAPYRTDFNRITAVSPARSGPYSADFGVRPAFVENQLTATIRDPNDIVELVVPTRVPRVSSPASEDDPGAVVDRLYWKANIRIIDGIWYRGSTKLIFDPEQHAPGLTNPDPLTDLNHAFARVLRYSWWWDVRESRVYCDVAGNDHCVTDGAEYQRGAQIRATDFDMAAFMALLDRSDARALLFAGGVIPSGGIVLYMSETYDPTYEDAKSTVARAANVRNLLNFPIMHNHLTTTDISAGTHESLNGLTRQAAVTSIVSATDPVPRTPHQLGWFPENLWGRNVASTRFESLTRPSGATNEAVAAFYGNPRAVTGFSDSNVATSRGGSTCAIPGVDYTTFRRPASRPTAFATAQFAPPCTQAGAQPLGPENAVRVVRAQTVPDGFTFVTDNRLYLHGDVNVRTNSAVLSGGFATSQDIGGRIAFIADSLTIQSERFADRTHQGDGGSANFTSFHKEPQGYAAEAWTAAAITNLARALPWSATASTQGGAADVCAPVDDELPFATRINASLLMGDVPACLNAGTDVGNASGGVNNFPRFVERWESGSGRSTTGIPLLINGSMVGLFRSERGNARFLSAETNSAGTVRQARSSSPYPDAGTNNICDYRPPLRQWTFDDVLLSGIDQLPPGTPRVVATDRLRWVRR
jgi:hypothetical protein